jgi:4,5-dihydroxyphthalate decarboxylase
MTGGGRKTLKTLIGTYPHTAPLKSGALRSDCLDFEFTEIAPVWDGFKGMIRDDKYDVSEMAVVTYLLAKAHGKPLALLPAAMIGRFQHPYAIYNATKGPMTPADLNGKRVGIRSFTTTTGAWIRGILANDYGVDLDSIEWVTFEEPHVAEYRDTTQRAPAGKKIVPMLLDGELDAVLGESSDDPRIKSLFGDPQAEAQRWYAKHKVVPINHLVVMRAHDVTADPDSAREVYRLLRAGKRLAGPPAIPDPVPFGVEANRPSLAMIAEYAFQQRLLPRRISVDDMFAETRELVGDERGQGRAASVA